MFNAIDFVINKLNIIGITVRPAYDTSTPKYPMIVVTQIDNSEDIQYTTIDTLERVSIIPIQLDCYARNMKIGAIAMSASEAADYYRGLADEIMQTDCGMSRTSSPPVIPHTTDTTVMRAISRYRAQYDINNELFYKK